MWIPWAVCLSFVGLSYWRLHDGNQATGAPAKRDCYVMSANFLGIALLGLASLAWSRLKPEPRTPATADDTADLSKPPKPKAHKVYLTRLKVFLTFIVIAHHVCVYFTKGGFHLLFLSDVPWGGPVSDKDKIMDQPGPSYRVYNILGTWFEWLNQPYFMAAFFLISGLFCPGSLNRKGLAAYTVDKIVRLGGPYVLYSVALGPATDAMNLAYAEYPVEYHFAQGPGWFILWLLNWSLIYGLLAGARRQFLPNLRVQLAMPHPLVLPPALGLVGGMTMWLVHTEWKLGEQGYRSVGGMQNWIYGLGIQLPFFLFGVTAGHFDWLEHLEQMKVWVAWTLRCYTLAWCMYLMIGYGERTIPLKVVVQRGHGYILWSSAEATYAFGMTLTQIQLFHQYFNKSTPSKLMRHASGAAYGVYLVHLPILYFWTIIYLELLKASRVPIAFRRDHFMVYSLDKQGNPQLLDGCVVWLGFFFLLIATNLVSWPLCHYLKKLPVLEKML